VKQISYTSDETFFVAGLDVDHAKQRHLQYGGEETAQKAWNALDYWDREERYSDFEVFEFRVTEKVTKVEPPYTA
jgi:hypothetical protein